jgi:hypothetical protein
LRRARLAGKRKRPSEGDISLGLISFAPER